MAMQPWAVRRGMRMLLETEAGPLRRGQREGKTQTVKDHRLAEGHHRLAEESQKLKWGMKLSQAGFG